MMTCASALGESVDKDKFAIDEAEPSFVDVPDYETTDDDAQNNM